MRSRFGLVLCVLVLLAALLASPATAAKPFTGVYDTVLVFNDGTGEVGLAVIFDCWDLRNSGAIRSVPGASFLQRGRITTQESEGDGWRARAQFQARLDPQGELGLGNRVRLQGNLLIDGVAGEKTLAGTFRGKLQPSGLLVLGSLVAVPARSGGICGDGSAPFEINPSE